MEMRWAADYTAGGRSETRRAGCAVLERERAGRKDTGRKNLLCRLRKRMAKLPGDCVRRGKESEGAARGVMVPSDGRAGCLDVWKSGLSQVGRRVGKCKRGTRERRGLKWDSSFRPALPPFRSATAPPLNLLYPPRNLQHFL